MKYLGHILYKMQQFIHWIMRQYQRTLFLSIGDNFHFDGGEFTYHNITIGKNVYIGGQAFFLSTDAKIHIGNNVLFGPRVMIVTGSHRLDVVGKLINEVIDKIPENDADVVINDDVWIGMNAMILKGVHIGRGSVIAAGAIVTRDIDEYTVYINPEKSYKRFNAEKLQQHINIMNERQLS